MTDGKGVSIQLVIAVTAITGLLGGTALALQMHDGPAATAEEPGPVNVRSTIKLDKYEVEDLYRAEMTLQAWAEIMNVAAAGEPELFETMIGYEPTPECTDSHWPKTPAGEPLKRPDLKTIEDIFICNRISAVQRTAPEREWETNLARSSTLLWKSLSPEGAIKLEIASQGYLAAASNNDDLKNYAKTFKHCKTAPEIETWLQTPHGSGKASTHWQTMSSALGGCIRAANERQFPQDHEKTKNEVTGPRPP